MPCYATNLTLQLTIRLLITVPLAVSRDGPAPTWHFVG
jgi:hypothetical protein